jgi:1-acyl-sn-glycerol-3-phosphate acyltransferase
MNKDKPNPQASFTGRHCERNLSARRQRTNEVIPPSLATTAINGDTSNVINGASTGRQIGSLKAALTKMGMIAFIASMCVALPLSILPINILHKLRVITRVQKECLSLRAGEFCARWSLRLFPFARVRTITSGRGNSANEPTVWVCNHTSMLDVFFFFLMAMDKRLRGRDKRLIKVVYWKQLEANPVTGCLFKSCGFIPIDMAANKPGEENEYDKATFKKFLKASKQAFEEGFDIGILPEGQLNPHPENGLLPVFSGAYTLARMSRRPIRMMAMNGAHHLWHPDENVGMTVTGRDVNMRIYPAGLRFKDKDDFIKVFTDVVGYFGRFGRDLPTEKLVENFRKGGQQAEAEDPLMVLGL